MLFVQRNIDSELIICYTFIIRGRLKSFERCCHEGDQCVRQAFYRITCGAAKRVIKKCSPRFSESIAERSLFIFSQPVQRNADRSFCLYGYVCLG